MTPDEIRDVVRRHVEHINTHDTALMASDHAENGVVESPSTGTNRGRQEIRQGYDRWISAFPDLMFTAEDVIAEGDRAALVFRIAATHQGDFLGLPATGRRVEFGGTFLLRVTDGEILHDRRVYDFSGLLIKLGVLKVKPA